MSSVVVNIAAAISSVDNLFLSMIFSPIPHMIGYGIVIAFGVLWAWILSTTFLPSLIVLKKWNLDFSIYRFISNYQNYKNRHLINELFSGCSIVPLNNV